VHLLRKWQVIPKCPSDKHFSDVDPATAQKTLPRIDTKW
jgi:hypothetical protein